MRNTLSVLSCVLRMLLLCFTGACRWDWHCRLSGIEGEHRFSCSHASNARRHHVPSGIPVIRFSASVCAFFFLFSSFLLFLLSEMHRTRGVAFFSSSLSSIFTLISSIKSSRWPFFSEVTTVTSEKKTPHLSGSSSFSFHIIYSGLPSWQGWRIYWGCFHTSGCKSSELCMCNREHF